MEFVSNGKLLSYLRRHRTDKTYYTTTSNTTSYTSKNDFKEKSLSSKDLILFAYQIAKGMEFICSHGVSPQTKLINKSIKSVNPGLVF